MNILSTLRAMAMLLSYTYPIKKLPEITFFTNYSKSSTPFFYTSLLYLNYEIQQNTTDSNKRIVRDSLRWIQTYGSYSKRESFSPSTIEKIWDEAAISIRTIVLCSAFLLATTEKDREYIKIAAQDHFYLLCLPTLYRAKHNHGFYQNVAALCFCETFPKEKSSIKYKKTIEKRILDMCAFLLTDEGFLKAHSPGYQDFFLYGHITILRHFTFPPSFKQALSEALIPMARSLRLFQRPNGTLAQIGDTSSVIPRSQNRKIMQTLPPLRSLEILSHSGYAFIHKKDSYLTFIGAFHSREHKHCDDLSISWDEGDLDILIDSGSHRYKGKFSPGTIEHALGFWYNSPPRVYIESIHAHNCVEINRCSPSRRVLPYGALPIEGGKITSDIYFLRSIWNRPDSFRQERLILFSPGAWLCLFDKLSPVVRGSVALMTQWLHFGKDFIVKENKDDELLLVHAIQKRRLYCRTLLSPQGSSLHQGEILPRLQGWSATDMETLVPHPAWGIHALALGERQFATICALDVPATCKIIQGERGEIFCSIGHKDIVHTIQLPGGK